MRRRFHRPGPLQLVAVFATALALAGIAYASIPAGDGTIRACYAKKDGLLLGIPYSKGDVRVVDEGTGCRSYETPLSWNQQGVPGTPGSTGPTGPTGPSDAYVVRQSDTPVNLPNGYADVISESLPAGQYVLNAKVSVGGVVGSFVECSLRVDGTVVDRSPAQFDGAAEEAIALQATTSGPGTATLACFGASGVFARYGVLTAIRVGQVHEA